MTEPLSEHEALERLNQLRSNVVATQSASWSNLMYPLVAILNAAGFERIEDVLFEDAREHLSAYGGAGGFPRPSPSTSQREGGVRDVNKFLAGMLAAIGVPLWFWEGAWTVMNPCGLGSRGPQGPACHLHLAMEAGRLLAWSGIGVLLGLLLVIVYRSGDR